MSYVVRVAWLSTTGSNISTPWKSVVHKHFKVLFWVLKRVAVLKCQSFVTDYHESVSFISSVSFVVTIIIIDCPLLL